MGSRMTSPALRPLSRRWNRTLSQARGDETEPPAGSETSLEGQPGLESGGRGGRGLSGRGLGQVTAAWTCWPLKSQHSSTKRSKVKGHGNKYFIFTLVFKPVDSFWPRSSEHLQLRLPPPPTGGSAPSTTARLVLSA